MHTCEGKINIACSFAIFLETKCFGLCVVNGASAVHVRAGLWFGLTLNSLYTCLMYRTEHMDELIKTQEEVCAPSIQHFYSP